MYLDRTYTPQRRRRGKGRFLWPLFWLMIVGIVLYEQQPSWLVPKTLQPTPVPTRSAVSYLSEAESWLRSGNIPNAIQAYQNVTLLEPQNPAPLVAQARLQIILRDIPAAYQLAQQAVEIAPEDPDALNSLARALDWLGDYEQAAQFAFDAYEFEPNNATTLAILGEIYTDQGSWAIAEDYLNQALALEPQNIMALRNKAYLHESQGDYEEAIAVYETAISVAPHRFDLYVEQGRQYRVGLYDYEKANESYKKAVDVYESAVTLDAYGFGLYNATDYLQAVRVLDRAVELDPSYGPAQAHYGMALYARRNYEDAAIALETGVRILGDEARLEQVYLGLSYVFKEPPECDKAIQWLQKVLEMDPTNGPALDGIRRCS